MHPQLAKTKSTGRPWLALGGIVVLFAALFATGLLPRLRSRAELAAAAQEAVTEVPLVNVVKPRRAPSSSAMMLPGNIEPILTASTFARTNGYLRRRLVDIGDRVRAGQLLGEIESPEVDQEYGQAQAALAQARAALNQKRAALSQATANMKLADATNARWKRLVSKGVLSRQEGDEKETVYAARQADVEAARADIAAAEANINSHEANVRRLQELRGFQKLTAPFDGVITARNGDTGDLITAGSGSSVREIYKLAQIGTLRIFINVPQPQVPSVKPGQAARVTVQEYPGRVFAGKVERTANALDPNSRTLLTEVQVSNPDRSLLPGMYAQVEFVATTANPGYLVPATVLVVRGDGSHTVATVGADNKVHYRKLKLGRDFGADTEVLSGLEGEERMIVNPADDLAEGAPVRTR